jgi:hypothetical protein
MGMQSSIRYCPRWQMDGGHRTLLRNRAPPTDDASVARKQPSSVQLQDAPEELRNPTIDVGVPIATPMGGTITAR